MLRYGACILTILDETMSAKIIRVAKLKLCFAYGTKEQMPLKLTGRITTTLFIINAPLQAFSLWFLDDFLGQICIVHLCRRCRYKVLRWRFIRSRFYNAFVAHISEFYL